jgi:hypothetical protein
MLRAMDGRAHISVAMALASGLLAIGCGGNGGNAKTSTVKRPAAGLQSPLYGSCAARGFAKPQITEITSSETAGRAWSLRSAHTQAPPRPGAQPRTDIVLVVELGPGGTLPKKRDPLSKIADIAGHSVVLRAPGKGKPVYTAQWKTSQATYTAVVGSSDVSRPPDRATVNQLVACLT